MVLKKVVLKKIMICLTCCMLVFASCVKPTKAFALVDDLTIAMILGGLCLAGGVVVSQDTIKDNVSGFVNGAVEKYQEFYGGLYEDAKNAVTGICTSIYDAGTVLASDFNNWIQGWFGFFVNDYVLQTYSSGTVSSPIFSGIDNFRFGDGKIPEYDFDISTNPLFGQYTVYSPPVLANGKHVHNYLNLATDILTLKFLLTSSTVSLFVKYETSNKFVPLMFSAGSSSAYTLPLSVPLYLTGKCHYFFEFANGTTAFYNFLTEKWSRDLDGTLELDPGVFNPDSLGDIDIAPPWTDSYLNGELDYTDKYIFGNDMTFDNVGDMTFPGTITVPKDWDYPLTDTDDYPIVIPTDTPMDTTVDDIVDKYPDFVPTAPDTDYKADWTTVFPFCLPFDLFRFLNLLNAPAKTPEFDFEFMGSKMHVDLKPFDVLAQISRIGFDITFIIGLIMVTRDKLIKA